MRNVAFLIAGLLLLLVQANLFRILEPLRITTVVVAWICALVIDLSLIMRDARSAGSQGPKAMSLRLYGSLPLFVLLAYGVFRSVADSRAPTPIPSLLLPIIVFMGVHEYSLARGAAVAFVLGYATDLVGIAPIGLYTFTYTATFVLARAAGVRLAAQTMWMQAVLALAFSLVHSVMIIVLLAIFGRDKDAWVPRSLYPLALPHALATGVVAPIIFRLAHRIHAATGSSPRPEAGGGRV